MTSSKLCEVKECSHHSIMACLQCHDWAEYLSFQTSQWVDSDESQTEPLYTRSISLTLNISPIVIISSNTHLHERLGVISGIILAIIFIILIFILLSIFLTRRRKTDKKYSSLADKTSSEDLLKPIWVPGMQPDIFVKIFIRQPS